MREGRIASLGDDLLQNILSRLPALSHASASCACRSWRTVCDRILLSRPKLLSALSLNPLLQVAFDEASSKILSEAIRPHFVIAFVGRNFSLKKTHELVRAKFGTRIPVISCLARGIIGSDALTSEVKEVKWNASLVNESCGVCNPSEYVDGGIVLIVGFVPGLKVNVIPLLRANEISSRGPLVESFLNDIKTYTASVSDCNTPMGIVMFADHDSDMRFVLEKMDCALGGETVIVGDERGCFLFSSGDLDGSETAGENQELLTTSSQTPSRSQRKHDAVGLIFAKDRDKTHGIREIHFNLALSAGVSPLGPTYKAASVRVTRDGTSECCTWLTARREGFRQKLDGQAILSDLEGEIENYHQLDGDFYMGVVKQRKCSKSGKGKFLSSFAFHEVISGDEECLFVEGDGIKTGDTFRFYFPNDETELASRNKVCEELKALKNGSTQDGKRVEVFGGLIFTCYGRGGSFFEFPNVDSSAFSENFPGVPLAGMFCTGEIGRLPSNYLKDGKEPNPIGSCLHVYSSVYLVMCYVQEPWER